MQNFFCYPLKLHGLTQTILSLLYTILYYRNTFLIVFIAIIFASTSFHFILESNYVNVFDIQPYIDFPSRYGSPSCTLTQDVNTWLNRFVCWTLMSYLSSVFWLGMCWCVEEGSFVAFIYYYISPSTNTTISWRTCIIIYW